MKGASTKERQSNNAISKNCCGRKSFPNCNGNVKSKSAADEICYLDTLKCY